MDIRQRKCILMFVCFLITVLIAFILIDAFPLTNFKNNVFSNKFSLYSNETVTNSGPWTAHPFFMSSSELCSKT